MSPCRTASDTCPMSQQPHILVLTFTLVQSATRPWQDQELHECCALRARYDTVQGHTGAHKCWAFYATCGTDDAHTGAMLFNIRCKERRG
jgi:hypothetical protein